MFDEWLELNGEEHKYYATFINIRDRFRRNVAKAMQRFELTDGRKTDIDNSLF